MQTFISSVGPTLAIACVYATQRYVVDPTNLQAEHVGNLI